MSHETYFDLDENMEWKPILDVSNQFEHIISKASKFSFWEMSQIEEVSIYQK